MATVPQQAKAPPATKYDANVTTHLSRARRRIRTLDVATGLLGFAAGTLLYALVSVLCYRWLQEAPLVRGLLFAGYVVAALAYLLVALVVPLCRRINPYYAARTLEQVVPGSKNSVVNWLDLHDRPLPPAIRGAIGQRAARDLAQADVERAISGRRVGWLGGLTGFLFLALVIAFLVVGVSPFFGRLAQAFAPFGDRALVTGTHLTLIQPEGGHATIPVGKAVRIAVEVRGRIPDIGKPDAVRLLYHYQQEDPYEERPLEHENDYEWATTVPPYQVLNGFYYKVAAGDAETPEYRVQVHATPLVNDFQVTYHYRPYLGWRDDTTADPNLRGPRGTEVTLLAHTNRTVQVKDSRLDVERSTPPPPQAGRGTDNKGGAARPALHVPAEAVPDDPQALRFPMVLEESGKYRVSFTSTDGESNTEARAYTIEVVQDHPPEVRLTKPDADVTLPANGVLRLEGFASDDYGVKGLVLHLQVANGPTLRAKPYREGKSFRLANNTYPRRLDYKDFVDLATVKDQNGKPVTLQPKMVLEYRLEATDSCDYPEPNVSRTKTYKVTIGEPSADQKQQQQERRQAQTEQQQHEAKQDQQMQQESEARQREGEQHGQGQQGGEQNDTKNGGTGSNGGNDTKKPDTDPKNGGANNPEGGEKDKPKEKPDDHNQGQNNPGQPGGGDPKAGGNANQNPHQQQEDKKLQEQANQLAKAIQKNEQQPGQKKGDPDKDSKGEGKGDNQSEPNEKPGQSKGDEGGGMGQPKPDAGQGKGPGGMGEQQPNAGQASQGGQPGANQDKGDSKDKGQGGTGTDTGHSKEGGQPPQPQGAGEGTWTPARSASEGTQQQQPKGQAQGSEGGELKHESSASKDAGNTIQETAKVRGNGHEGTGAGQQSNGAAKDDPEKLTRGTTKDQGDKGAGGNNKPGTAGDKNQGSTGGTGAQGDTKPAPEKGDGDAARGESKDSGNAEDARPEDVERLAKKAHQGEGKEGHDAAKTLDEISREARDPAVREAARKQSEQLGREEQARQPKPGSAKDKPQSSSGQVGPHDSARSGEARDAGSGQKPGESASKDAGTGEQGMSRGESRGAGKQGSNTGSENHGKPEAGEGGAVARSKGYGGEPGSQPTEGTGGGTGRPDMNPPEQQSPKHTEPPDPRHQKQAGDLELVDFSKVDRKVLEDAHMSREEWDRFQRKAAEWYRRHGREMPAAEKLPAPQPGTLPSTTVHEVTSGQGGKNDVQGDGRALPPPGYRKSAPEFSSKLGQQH